MESETEGQNLEFKARFPDSQHDVAKVACAFANAFGGKLEIGIGDRGEVVGVSADEVDSVQKHVGDAIQMLSPVPFYKITVEKRQGKSIVITEVSPMGRGFCTLGGIVYHRFGSQNRKLEGKTLHDFLIHRQVISFDESQSDALLEDIDPETLEEFLRIRNPSLKFEKEKMAEYLTNLRLARRNGNLKINNAALLFFSKEPARFIPQSEVKLVRFKGTEAHTVIDSAYAKATIPILLDTAEKFIEKNTRMAHRIEGMYRVEVPEYPKSVVREALVNAIAHRDYFNLNTIQVNIFDDRMQITNPGTLPEGLTLQILGTIAIQRNPITYEIMRDLHLVEAIGTGITRMRQDMRTAGLPEPAFEEVANFFRVTLYNSKRPLNVQLSPRQQICVEYLEKNPTISAKTYMQINSVSLFTAATDLKDLMKKGVLDRIGKTRGAYYVFKKG